MLPDFVHKIMFFIEIRAVSKLPDRDSCLTARQQDSTISTTHISNTGLRLDNTGGNAAVNGLRSGHFRRRFRRSSDSSCKIEDPDIRQGRQCDYG